MGDDPRRSVLSNCTTSHGGCLTFSLGSRLWSGVERGSNLIRVFAVRRTCKRPPSDPVLRHRWISAKAVVVSLVHRGVLRDAFAEVSHFRYACLTAGGDALFELCDALLCTDGPVRTLADLASRRNTAVGTGLCTAGSTRADRRRPATSGPGQGVPLPRAADGRLVLAVDVSPWLRPDSNTCADRAFCHTFGRGEGKHQMVPGWPYSVVAALESGRTSWTAVLDAVRLEPGADVAAVTTVQIGEVIERLVAAGQWRPGDPEVLGPNSLARSPALITADVTLGP
ncbi:transposase [Streptomyces sp. NPDC015127]|uniref:transposase n=1 Tax=Streptomyces sp. NPDC015127 TaxID=3364939 RepID=UPI0036F5A082